MLFKFIDLYFTTITIFNWNKLFDKEEFVELIFSSLNFLTSERRVTIYAFVEMHDHIHLIWFITKESKLNEVLASFKSCTAKKVIKLLFENTDSLRSKFYVNKPNRKFQIWEDNSYSFEIFYFKTLNQKMAYVHDNPRRAGYVNDVVNYKYSSLQSYLLNKSLWPFLTLF